MAASKIKDLTTGFGTLSYGGYTFSALRSVQFRYEPRYDRAKRSIIAIDCYLSVTGKIHGSQAAAPGTSSRATTESRMDAVAAALNRRGSRLVISDIGLSSGIDTGTTTPDIDFGPTPTVLACSPFGGDLAWSIAWEVHFTIPPKCLSVTPVDAGATMSFEFDVTYTTTDEGLLTRIINGEIGIVNYRSGNKIAANPEAAYDKINFACPAYFRPETFTRTLDRKRNMIQFLAVHTELTGSAFPQGIVHADLDYDLENKPPGFLQWAGSLSGTMRTAPGVPKSMAADKFFIIMFDVAAKLNATAGPKGIVIPERIRFGSKLFGRDSRFSVQWRMTACLHEILAKSGLWSAVPGTDYGQWRASMIQLGVWDQRGGSRLKFNANDDVIVDVCDAPAKFNLGNDGGGRASVYDSTELRLTCPEVTKENSYLFFSNAIQGTQSQNMVIHKIMQAVGLPTQRTTGDGTIAPFLASVGGAGAAAGSTGSIRDHVPQLQTKTDDFVLMTGRGLRLKFTPEIPALSSVAGVTVEEVARSIKVEPVVSYFDCPLISARWSILYRVRGSLYGVKVPKVKEFCMTEGEEDGRK